MKTSLRLTTFPHWVLLLLVLGFAGPTASQAQRASAQPDGLPAPAPLRVIIRPLLNSPLLRVYYESDQYGSVHFRIRNERGSVLYDDMLRASRYAGTFDLAALPAGRYTVELQIPADHHEEAIQVGKPIPAIVALVAKQQQPSAAIH